VSWYFYVLLCADGTLYAGISNDPDARLKKHNRGGGAKYLRPKYRRPGEIVYTEKFDDKVAAMKREYRFKQLSRRHKLTIVGMPFFQSAPRPADRAGAARRFYAAV